MNDRDKYLELDDAKLLAQCRLETYRSSGPGGQHRNKVSSAVRLTHSPTGASAHGDDSRSQQDNKKLALSRLRMNIALQIRCPIDITAPTIPPVVQECIFQPKGSPAGAKRMQVGRKDRRFWQVAAFLLDAAESCDGSLATAAGIMGITTSNMVTIIQSDRHLLAAAQAAMKKHGRRPIV